MSEQRGGFLRTKIARRIFALFVLCALLPLVVLAFFSFMQISGQLEEQASYRLHQRSKAIGLSAHERLISLEGDLQVLAEEITRTQSRNLERSIKELAWSAMFKFDGLLLLDAEGEEIHRLNEAPEGLEFPTAARAHLAEGNSWLFTVARGLNKADILLARAVPPADGESNILIGQISSDYFWESKMLKYEFDLHVIDRLGRVLETTLSTADGEVLDVSSSLEVNMAFRWEGQEQAYQAYCWQLFMQRHFLDDWTFVLSQDEKTILGPMQSLRRNFILATILSCLLVALLSSQQIRRSMTPILQLRQATEKVSEDDFGVQVEINSKDEFGDLGQAFNQMTERLKNYRTEREQNEQDLLDAFENALRAATLESQFLANVSHELRTPITSIRSFAELLREYGDEDTETKNEFLGIIVAESDRLMRLIEDILDFSRISSGSLRMDYQQGPLEETLVDVVKSLEPLAGRTGAMLRIEIDGVLPEMWYDRDRIIQLWTNLISNAIKFSMIPGDRIDIRARVENREIIVEVQDEGPGIKPEDQQFIFQRFRQVSTDLITDKPKGTGLGLTIANDIAYYHEGRIEVESTEGEGATFRVYLPVLGRKPKLKGPPPSSEADFAIATAN
ncbi:MAG: sensor histidine kinase [Planctomycetota bacterium]|jgi:signal transduction histidine kinase